jgi:membrane glycosyltransferase
LQTAPQLIGATTFFGRLQQFAACVYGPVITRGLSAWSGDSGNYWGHNAIIRMVAFAQHCGLPKLPGRKPFGGFILSHDFVEAALMRRAGWKVRMATDCGGSWEESPPSLIDIAIRDRRWAQGNLQHMKIIGSAGLSFASRMHLGVGIMSYLSAPLWLVMLSIGFALAIQSHLIRPEYFNHDFQLFPSWPRFNVELMMALFWFSMLVLLIPKMLGLIHALLSKRIRRGGGGVIGIGASFLLEVVLSALYAPILMLIQSGHVFAVFMGRDSGWNPQRRDDGGTTWSDAWHFHKRHMFLSCVTAVIVWFLSPPLLAWLAPALLGLFFAVPLSRASGSKSLGRLLSRLALLRTPEETETPALVRRRGELLREAGALPEDGLRHLARNREARLIHTNGNLARPADPRGHPDPFAFTAEQKLKDARSLDEALAWLTPVERVEVAGDARLLNQLAFLPDAEYPLFLI